ncbi:unnamed protein product [Nezara viridula]|uniref:Uncharacterized protein n=1 Tax=Nezara viridula TaxID=85310 RepID=A0A9P0EAE7_NEZVI|nr:unnamed protein product [Nezara viridula]
MPVRERLEERKSTDFEEIEAKYGEDGLPRASRPKAKRALTMMVQMCLRRLKVAAYSAERTSYKKISGHVLKMLIDKNLKITVKIT